ncbi:PLP-dependent aminotransferase family protein [Cytobacillus firmus]|uniref:aminotransferase-like domain-containing protein n=1 Tax=Cytobacillus firmus TaxID=1399 RepID=UPI0015811D29|nr:PLP-dependent aminotransferase family protein [Cytobacillus firmus]MBG9550298.1 aminotransferase [Cytobacillus firmus]MBG9603864.1 aminotransferase [Cytobacillus firmus]MBG9655546.1 aminotransferase [Cytobacillus firmus]MED1907474.1 PLP-dependent aminotransferase family protein [Cytobacillus firmus]MED1940842.1 PLP-dependent aminotransferase family protein [Cytobacillus firmus]
MNNDSLFTDKIKKALQNTPPGEWIPEIPEDCIRLHCGYPAPDLVPVEEVKAAVNSLLEEEQDLPLHYIGSPKILKLKEQVLKRLKERGISVAENELLITSGACQAIDLIARILLDEETVIAIESPTYMEALEIFQNYTKHIISIPVDKHGLQTEVLKEILEERKQKGLAQPRFLYTIPTFQNPTGTTMTGERRQHVLELANKYNFLLVEDDAYGELSFNKSLPTLKAMDQNSRVLHVGSLSKIVAPGMRIGWIAGASEMIHACAWFKKDLNHPFAQSAMAVYFANTDFNNKLETLRDTYRSKCDVLTSALEQYLPESASWYVPEGGYFVWMKIPGADTSELLTHALAEGVSFIPGKYFFMDQAAGTEFLRLSFSYAPEKEITEGIRRLGRVAEAYF